MIYAMRFMVAFVAATALFWAGLGAGFWWDRRAPHTPSVKVLFWHWTAPESLKAKMGDLIEAENAARLRALQIAANQVAITAKAQADEAAAQARIITVTRTITKEIPLVITPAIDRGYPLSVGFVRLWNASALGVDLPDAGYAPGLANDATAPTPASSFAGTFVASNGNARANAEQLAALQAWVRTTQANFNQGTKP